MIVVSLKFILKNCRSAFSSLPRKWQITVVAALLLSLLRLQILLFGFGATRQGGLLGRFVDNMVRQSMFRRAMIKHEERFLEQLTYCLPQLDPKNNPNKVGLPVLLNSWLAESMIRAHRREYAIDYHVERSNIAKTCPLHILQPNWGSWYRPIEWAMYNATRNHNPQSMKEALIFDDEKIVEFMQEHFAPLYRTFYQQVGIDEQVQLFGFAAVYFFGGIFLSPEIRTSEQLSQVAPGLKDWINGLEDCKPAMWFQSVHMDTIQVFAATPKHPSLKCVINEMLSDHGGGWQSLYSLIARATWDPTCEPRCCPLQRSLEEHSSDVIVTVERDHDETSSEQNYQRQRFEVTLTEKPGTKPSEGKMFPKNRKSTLLRSKRCSAGWMCNRCLRMPFRGSLHSCRFVCRSCYENNVCLAPEKTRNDVVLEVAVKERKYSKQNRIPHIIHQTWFEELTTARYPQYQRLQNSWKAAGWEYRFYNDDDCLEYIQKNFPKRFVDAYDAIVPGAFKADFFRLLVLFKEGGVYADIDVKLDVDLDSFVTRDMAFFVPRDVPLDYWPDSNYCLWNGLMGAQPGHPIIAKVIEDMTTTVLNRVDYLDIEGSLCLQDPKAEIWKLRTLPILLLTGPCALGMSVNAALGNPNKLQGHNLGWLDTRNVSKAHSPPDYFWGDALTLLTDRYDLGELRFTDIDRNLPVGSTNQDRIAKAAIKREEDSLDDGAPEKTNIHYSKSETDIVGESGIYRDSLAANEQIRLEIRHEYV